MRSYFFKRPHLFNYTFKSVLLSRSNTKPTFFHRSIVHVKNLQGSYNAYKHKEFLSPFHGAILHHIGSLNKLYEIAQKPLVPSAILEMVKTLFYKDKHHLRCTQHKSNPAYSLNVFLIAKLLNLISSSDFNKLEKKLDFLKIWQNNHKNLVNTHLPVNKAYAFLNLMGQAKQECETLRYPKYFTETILSAFLFHKCHTAQDIQFFLQILLNTEQVLELSDGAYSDQAIIAMVENIVDSNLTEQELDQKIQQHVESFLYLYLKKFFKLQKVLNDNYGYQGKVSRPNCVEAFFHNLCNILLYNENKDIFDFSLLPKNLKPHPNFIAFYAMHDFKVEQVNTPIIGQTFMNLVSGLNFLRYFSTHYELDCDINNFIPLLNFLFGSHASTFDELSTQFSDQHRRIIFTEHEDEKGRIDIVILTKNKHFQKITCILHSTHSALLSNHFDPQNSLNPLQISGLENITQYIEKKIDGYAILQPFIKSFANMIKDLPYNRGFLNYFFIYFFPQSLEQMIQYVEIALLYAHDFPEIQNYAAHVIFQSEEILYMAVKNNKFNVVKFCIERGLDVNIKNKLLEDMPLHHAQDPELVKVLLEAKANPNSENKWGSTPIFLCHHEEIVMLLLNAGANPKHTNTQKRTPLHHVNKINIAKILIEAGADVNAQDAFGATPLHNIESLSVVELLLQAGADPFIQDNKGKMAIDGSKHMFQKAEFSKLIEKYSQKVTHGLSL